MVVPAPYLLHVNIFVIFTVKYLSSMKVYIVVSSTTGGIVGVFSNLKKVVAKFPFYKVDQRHTELTYMKLYRAMLNNPYVTLYSIETSTPMACIKRVVVE